MSPASADPDEYRRKLYGKTDAPSVAPHDRVPKRTFHDVCRILSRRKVQGRDHVGHVEVLSQSTCEFRPYLQFCPSRLHEHIGVRLENSTDSFFRESNLGFHAIPATPRLRSRTRLLVAVHVSGNREEWEAQLF